MGKFSRNKGARGERAFCSLCRQHGWNATRTAQHSGKAAGVADVIGLPGLHVEVKNVERLNIRDALSQAIRDAEAAGKGEVPIVAHKKNNCDWLITLRADDFFNVAREYMVGELGNVRPFMASEYEAKLLASEPESMFIYDEEGRCKRNRLWDIDKEEAL